MIASGRTGSSGASDGMAGSDGEAATSSITVTEIDAEVIDTRAAELLARRGTGLPPDDRGATPGDHAVVGLRSSS